MKRQCPKPLSLLPSLRNTLFVRRLGLLAGALALFALGWALPARAGPSSSRDYQGEAKGIAAKQLEQFGKGYSARYDNNRHILYVSALDEAHLKETIGLLAAFTEAYRRTLASDRGEGNITVVLPTAEDYKKLELPFPDCVGFYSYAGRRLVAIDRGRTLIHEFTHALHHADMTASRQSHPIWIAEGLATLFEASTITPSGLVPKLDMRLATLQKAIREKKTFPLKDLLSMGRKPFMQDAAVAYAQARYLMYYLYEQGRLDDFYSRYKNTFTHDPQGIAAFEAAAGNKLFIIDRDWQKWVLDKALPSSERRCRQGRLGLELQRVAQGAKIVGLQDASAAKTAGRLKVGDIIEQFNGQAIRNEAELAAAIRSAGAMQTVKVQLLRNSRRMTVLQPLGGA